MDNDEFYPLDLEGIISGNGLNQYTDPFDDFLLEDIPVPFENPGINNSFGAVYVDIVFGIIQAGGKYNRWSSVLNIFSALNHELKEYIDGKTLYLCLNTRNMDPLVFSSLVRRFPNIVYVEFRAPISSRLFSIFSEFPLQNIQSLSVTSARNLSEREIIAFHQRHRNLQTLRLANCTIMNYSTLQCICSFENLVELDITGFSLISNSEFSAISRLKELRTLRIRSCQIFDDNSLDNLSQSLHHLENLYLIDCSMLYNLLGITTLPKLLYLYLESLPFLYPEVINTLKSYQIRFRCRKCRMIVDEDYNPEIGQHNVDLFFDTGANFFQL